MRSQIKDDWEKPRGKGQHLTAQEIQQLRIWYNCGEKSRSAARKLKCSTRTVEKYFADFGGKSNRPVRPPFERKLTRIRSADDEYYFDPDRPKIPFDPVKHREARFYKGNFEL